MGGGEGGQSSTGLDIEPEKFALPICEHIGKPTGDYTDAQRASPLDPLDH